jgi:iron complex transport system permease protein
MIKPMVLATFPLVLLLSIALLLTCIGSLALGDFQLSWHQVINGLLQPNLDTEGFVVWELRLPRFLTGLLSGGALGMAGAIVQSITRNPLASPSLMGVSSGAAFTIVFSFVFFELSTTSTLMFGTFGGMIAAILTFSIAWKTHLNPIHLTLAGMSISLFFSAGITVLLISANSDTAGIYYWLAGSIANKTWQHVGQLYPYVVVGLVLGISFSRPLNLLMLDDITCRSLGVPIHWWRLMLGTIAVLLTAATVAVAGPISFIGLISPHLVRFYFLSRKQADKKYYSNEHLLVLPCSALVGGLLVCCADLLAKYQEVPVGILSILLGGPLFVYLIRKQSL